MLYPVASQRDWWLKGTSLAAWRKRVDHCLASADVLRLGDATYLRKHWPHLVYFCQRRKRLHRRCHMANSVLLLRYAAAALLALQTHAARRGLYSKAHDSAQQHWVYTHLRHGLRPLRYFTSLHLWEREFRQRAVMHWKRRMFRRFARNSRSGSTFHLRAIVARQQQRAHAPAPATVTTDQLTQPQRHGEAAAVVDCSSPTTDTASSVVFVASRAVAASAGAVTVPAGHRKVVVRADASTRSNTKNPRQHESSHIARASNSIDSSFRSSESRSRNESKGISSRSHFFVHQRGEQMWCLPFHPCQRWRARVHATVLQGGALFWALQAFSRKRFRLLRVRCRLHRNAKLRVLQARLIWNTHCMRRQLAYWRHLAFTTRVLHGMTTYARMKWQMKQLRHRLARSAVSYIAYHRAALRYPLIKLQRGLALWRSYTIYSIRTRRCFLVFRKLHPIPRCSVAAHLFTYWRDVYLPARQHQHRAYRALVSTRKHQTLRRCVLHWESLAEDSLDRRYLLQTAMDVLFSSYWRKAQQLESIRNGLLRFQGKILHDPAALVTARKRSKSRAIFTPLTLTSTGTRTAPVVSDYTLLSNGFGESQHGGLKSTVSVLLNPKESLIACLYKHAFAVRHVNQLFAICYKRRLFATWYRYSRRCRLALLVVEQQKHDVVRECNNFFARIETVRHKTERWAQWRALRHLYTIHYQRQKCMVIIHLRLCAKTFFYQWIDAYNAKVIAGYLSVPARPSGPQVHARDLTSLRSTPAEAFKSRQQIRRTYAHSLNRTQQLNTSVGLTTPSRAAMIADHDSRKGSDYRVEHGGPRGVQDDNTATRDSVGTSASASVTRSIVNKGHKIITPTHALMPGDRFDRSARSRSRGRGGSSTDSATASQLSTHRIRATTTSASYAPIGGRTPHSAAEQVRHLDSSSAISYSGRDRSVHFSPPPHPPPLPAAPVSSGPTSARRELPAGNRSRRLIHRRSDLRPNYALRAFAPHIAAAAQQQLTSSSRSMSSHRKVRAKTPPPNTSRRQSQGAVAQAVVQGSAPHHEINPTKGLSHDRQQHRQSGNKQKTAASPLRQTITSSYSHGSVGKRATAIGSVSLSTASSSHIPNTHAGILQPSARPAAHRGSSSSQPSQKYSELDVSQLTIDSSFLPAGSIPPSNLTSIGAVTVAGMPMETKNKVKENDYANSASSDVDGDAECKASRTSSLKRGSVSVAEAASASPLPPPPPPPPLPTAAPRAARNSKSVTRSEMPGYALPNPHSTELQQHQHTSTEFKAASTSTPRNAASQSYDLQQHSQYKGQCKGQSDSDSCSLIAWSAMFTIPEDDNTYSPDVAVKAGPHRESNSSGKGFTDVEHDEGKTNDISPTVDVDPSIATTGTTSVAPAVTALVDDGDGAGGYMADTSTLVRSLAGSAPVSAAAFDISPPPLIARAPHCAARPPSLPPRLPPGESSHEALVEKQKQLNAPPLTSQHPVPSSGGVEDRGWRKDGVEIGVRTTSHSNSDGSDLADHFGSNYIRRASDREGSSRVRARARALYTRRRELRAGAEGVMWGNLITEDSDSFSSTRRTYTGQYLARQQQQK